MPGEILPESSKIKILSVFQRLLLQSTSLKATGFQRQKVRFPKAGVRRTGLQAPRLHPVTIMGAGAALARASHLQGRRWVQISSQRRHTWPSFEVQNSLHHCLTPKGLPGWLYVSSMCWSCSSTSSTVSSTCVQHRLQASLPPRKYQKGLVTQLYLQDYPRYITCCLTVKAQYSKGCQKPPEPSAATTSKHLLYICPAECHPLKWVAGEGAHQQPLKSCCSTFHHPSHPCEAGAWTQPAAAGSAPSSALNAVLFLLRNK